MIQARPHFAAALDRYREALGAEAYRSLRLCVAASAVEEVSMKELIARAVRSESRADKADREAKGCIHICGLEGCKEVGRKLCSRCRLVYYCSKEHQLKAWKEGHKKICVARKQESGGKKEGDGAVAQAQRATADPLPVGAGEWQGEAADVTALAAGGAGGAGGVGDGSSRGKKKKGKGPKAVKATATKAKAKGPSRPLMEMDRRLAESGQFSYIFTSNPRSDYGLIFQHGTGTLLFQLAREEAASTDSEVGRPRTCPSRVRRAPLTHARALLLSPVPPSTRSSITPPPPSALQAYPTPLGAGRPWFWTDQEDERPHVHVLRAQRAGAAVRHHASASETAARE